MATANKRHPAALRTIRCILVRNPIKLAHDRWFRAKVQESLDKIENGTAVYHDHDAMWDSIEAEAQTLVEKRDAVHRDVPV